MKRKTKNALISRKPQKCPEMLLKVIDDVPEGEPLFLYSSAIGFYSKGCSHVVFRDGVPQHEHVSVMTKIGPLRPELIRPCRACFCLFWLVFVDIIFGFRFLFVLCH